MNIRRTALALLARREHARRELAEKLARRFAPAEIATVLDELIKNGMLSDLRFCREYLRQTGDKFGRPALRQKLQCRGVCEEDIDTVLAEITADECARAISALSAKYGSAALTEIKSRARAERFLSARGFEEEDVSQALAMHQRQAQQ